MFTRFFGAATVYGVLGDHIAAAGAVSGHFGAGQLVLAAPDASGPPAAASSGPPARILLARGHDKKRSQA
jgi:hypothetical protein